MGAAKAKGTQQRPHFQRCLWAFAAFGRTDCGLGRVFVRGLGPGDNHLRLPSRTWRCPGPGAGGLAAAVWAAAPGFAVGCGGFDAERKRTYGMERGHRCITQGLSVGVSAQLSHVRRLMHATCRCRQMHAFARGVGMRCVFCAGMRCVAGVRCVGCDERRDHYQYYY